MAKLIPLTQQRPRRKLGTLKGRLKVDENFDAPLPADIIDEVEAAAGLPASSTSDLTVSR
jgi:hypothetical protein